MTRLIIILATLLAAHSAFAGDITIPVRDEAARDLGERSPQLRVTTTAAPWMRKTEHAGVVYFLYAFPARIERYSLNSGDWLAPISLGAVPRGFGVSAAGIFVSQNTRVSRFELDGTSESILPPAVWTNAVDFAVLGNYLLTTRQAEIQSVRISDYTQAAVYNSFGGYDTPGRISVASQANLIYGWQVGLSPSDILKIPLNADGTFGSATPSPYHGDFPAGSVVFPDANGQFIVDEAGIAFYGNNLTYRSGTGGPVNDTTLSGSDRFVLHQQSVARLDASFREVGMVPLAQEAHAVAVSGDSVHLFRDTGSGPDAEIIPIAQFSQPAAGSAPDPRTVPFSVDYADLADDGMLYLFNKAQRVVHRFSVNTWQYLPSVSLPGTPIFAAVDRAGSRVYVAYEGGRLGIIPSGAAREEFFGFSPITPNGIGAADDLLLVSDSTGAWDTHRIYNSAGVETSSEDWNYYSRDYAWSRVNRRIYFFRDNTSPNDIHFEEISVTGLISSEGESPYHGSVLTQLPIRPSPSGAYVYLGSGQVFDAINLSLVGNLPLPPRDLTWIGNSPYSLHAAAQSGRTRVIRWTQSNTISAEGVIAGEAARVFNSAGQLITVASVGGTTRINRWPANLSGTNVAVRFTDPNTSAAPGAPVTFTVQVTNHGFARANDVQLSVSLSAPINQLTWLCEGPAGAIPCGTPTGLQLTAPLEPGESLLASAFGYMPNQAPAPIEVLASTSSGTADIDPADDVAIVTITLLDGMFKNGFE